MSPAVEGASERQPLLELQQHESQEAGVAAESVQQPSAGPAPESACVALASAAGAAAQPLVQPSERRCRYCLQDEEAGNELEAPCSCAGSIKWAHHDCVQRWVNEKRDKRCEICGSEFKGTYRQPPPAPPLRSALVAQLQVTNDDTRIVSLADPVTGEVVARMVVGPGGEPTLAAAADVSAGAAAPAAVGSTGSTALAGCLLLLLYISAWVGLVVTIPLSMAADAGDAIHLVRLGLICTVLVMRVVVWPTFSQQDGQRLQPRHVARRRRVLLEADLESGLGPQRPQPSR